MLPSCADWRGRRAGAPLGRNKRSLEAQERAARIPRSPSAGSASVNGTKGPGVGCGPCQALSFLPLVLCPGPWQAAGSIEAESRSPVPPLAAISVKLEQRPANKPPLPRCQKLRISLKCPPGTLPIYSCYLHDKSCSAAFPQPAAAEPGATGVRAPSSGLRGPDSRAHSHQRLRASPSLCTERLVLVLGFAGRKRKAGETDVQTDSASRLCAASRHR